MKLGKALGATAPVKASAKSPRRGLSSTERGRALKSRRKAMGLIELKVWVSPNDADDLRGRAAKSCKRHERQFLLDQAKAAGQKTLFE